MPFQRPPFAAAPSFSLKRIRGHFLATSLAFLPVASLEAQSPPTADQGSVDNTGKFHPSKPPQEQTTPPANPAQPPGNLIEKTGETTFRIGLVTCDRATKTITIPVQVKLREGPIEYALVTNKGKVHESLLVTDASPLHIQTAALLLGLSPQPGKGKPIPVVIEVEWSTNGPKRKLRLEELVALAKETPQAKTGATLAPGPWNFQGSTMDSDGFAAERDGSIIALISDPSANIGNPRPGHEDDDLFTPHTASLPPQGLPLSLLIHPPTSAPP